MILGRVEKLAADHLPEPLLLMARRSVRELFLALSLQLDPRTALVELFRPLDAEVILHVKLIFVKIQLSLVCSFRPDQLV